MPDEVGDDNSSLAPSGDRLRRELTDQLLQDLCAAERLTSLRDAALFLLSRTIPVVQRLADLEQALGRFPSPAPILTLISLHRALAGLEEGKVDPMLAPAMEGRRRVLDAAEDKHQGNRAGTLVGDLMDRATAAVAMETLMLADWGRDAAAQEVAKLLQGTPITAGIKGEPWRAVARWRDTIVARKEKRDQDEMAGQDVDFATLAAGWFNSFIGPARRLQQAGETPEKLVGWAHALLDRIPGQGRDRNSGLARAKSEPPEG